MKKRTVKENIKLKGGLRKINKSPRNEIYLVLDNIRSMYNIGAMFRTADAVRVKKIFLCGICATPPRNKIYKTSLGAVEWVDWEYVSSAKLIVQNLKQEGVQIVCLEQTDDSVDYAKAKYKLPIAIVLGHELRGISNDALSLADLRVEIPMHGRANSLNVATAAGVILFDVIAKTRTSS
jgi:tRNA G18 (ribose-2'-O)-methylase SpoU